MANMPKPAASRRTISDGIKNPYAKALDGKKLVVHILRRGRTAKSSRARPAKGKK